MTVHIDGLILAGGHLTPGRLAIAGDRLAPPGGPSHHRLVLPAGWAVAPGLVDLQVNGFVGADIGPDPAAVERIAAALPAHGVTAFCPTVITRPRGDHPAVAAALRRARPRPGAAIILAPHLEGPFLAPLRAGAHDPAHLGAPTAAAVGRLADLFAPAIVTLAPELPDAPAAIAQLAGRGVVVGVGHTEADAATARRAIGAGARLLTHAFNAMAGIAHRRPSALVAALADPRVAIGLIGDGVHVAPEVALLAARLAGNRLTLVSDAVALAGHRIARARLAGRTIRRVAGRSLAADGALAGAAVGLGRGPATLAGAGLGAAAALDAAAGAPRRLLGLPAGLAPGDPADLVVVDRRLRPRATIIGGRLVYRSVALEGLAAALDRAA